MNSQKRSKDRHKKIIKTAWSGLVSRMVSIGVSLLMVPLAVHYLGKEQYGLWITASSLVAMLGFMDGGAGNAVINLVAHASGEGHGDLARIVSTAFFSLMVLALFGCLLFLAVFPFVSWGNLLGVTEPGMQENLQIVIIIVGLFFFVSMLTTLVGKIQRGLQQGNLDNFWSGLGALLSLLFVYIAIQQDAGLIGFVIASLSGPILSYLASNIHYLLISRIDLRPQPGKIDWPIAKNLFAVGGMFFVLQIVVVIQNQADNVIIANMLGAEAVTAYAICMKLFLMIPMLFSLLLTPLWPAYREAIASGDMQWVKHIFLKSIRWALLISIPSAIGLFLLGAKIIELWVGRDSIPSNTLLSGCALWLILMSIGNALAVLLNGLQLVRVQLIVATSAGLMNIILSIGLIKLIGVAGAVFGSVISYFVFTLVPYFLIIKKMLNKFDGGIQRAVI